MRIVFPIIVGLAATAANADLIAHWNFNGSGSVANSSSTNIGTVDTSIASGTGSLTTSGLTTNTITAGATNGVVGSFGGTLNNAAGADVAGFALAVTGGLSAGGSPVTSNGGSLIFTVSTTGATGNLVVTYSTRGTASGAISQAWDFSTDGGSTWTPLTTFATAPGTTFVTRTVTFPVSGAAYGISNLMTRVTLGGATSNTGNNRFDNVQFNATVPTPGSAALLGAGLVASARRRRA